MAKKNEMSKFMAAEAAKEAARKKLRKEMAKQGKEEDSAPVEEVRAKELPLSPNAGKTTNLVFFRQYNTYQALLEIYPRESIDVSGCFSKTILYIMKWFRKRLGENAYEEYPDDKTGKGKGDNMLRIYFYYSPEMKKSVIGYMPGHLPTRKDGH